MTNPLPPELYVTLIMAVPALIGGRMAFGRGLLWPVWGIACGIFPVFLLVVWLKKPVKEVQGFFRRCGECGEWIKWKEVPCRHCDYRRIYGEKPAA